MFHTHWYFIIQLLIITENDTIFKTVEKFRHVLSIFIFLFSPPWRWSREWPKHVGDHCAVKLQP